MKTETARLKKCYQRYIKKSCLTGPAVEVAAPNQDSRLSSFQKTSHAQEQHHAMHALTFLFFLVRGVTLQKKIKRRLISRIIHHLMDLREFLHEPHLNALVNDLYETLQSEYDRSLGPMTRGVHKALKALVAALEWNRKKHFLLRFSALLNACCESDKKVSVSMDSWLEHNQSKILRFAAWYEKRSLFEDLIQKKGTEPNGQA